MPPPRLTDISPSQARRQASPAAGGEMATGEEAEAEARAARRKEIEANVAEAKRKQAAQAVEAAAASAAATGGFTPLSKQQVVEKLNSVPVFTVTTLEKQLVPVPDEGGSTCCRWYADVDEAQSALVLAQHLNPNTPLVLGVTPLGTAFALVHGWAKGENELVRVMVRVS